jgi:hypothetical protein
MDCLKTDKTLVQKKPVIELGQLVAGGIIGEPRWRHPVWKTVLRTGDYFLQQGNTLQPSLTEGKIMI